MYAKIEMGRLQYLKFHQGALRADLYQGIVDATENDTHSDAASIGKKIILPSSFTGGPRHMAQLYADAMSVIRAKGKPDLFITATCDPKL